MNRESTTVKKYFKEVRKHLSCSWSVKRGFTKYIKEQLDENVLYDKTITREKLVELLGEPKKVAEGFDIANQKEIRIRAKAYTLSMLLTIALIVIAVLLVIVLVVLYRNWGGEITISD